MTTENHEAHVADWWMHLRGVAGESDFERWVALELRGRYLALVDGYIERLGERVGGPAGILAAYSVPREVRLSGPQSAERFFRGRAD